MKRILTVSMALFIMVINTAAQERFCIAKDGKTAAIVVDEQDWKGVIRAANDLGDDVRKVAGVPATLLVNSEQRIANSIKNETY